MKEEIENLEKEFTKKLNSNPYMVKAIEEGYKVVMENRNSLIFLKKKTT